MIQMSRGPRIDLPNTCYHVISRSIKGLDLFVDSKDYETFLSKLLTLKTEESFKLHCYCLMSTHFHLCIETGKNQKLSKIMHRLNTHYTVYFNNQHQLGGPLFRNRYKSIIVDKDNYLLSLSRYIYLNPVKAGVVDLPENYLWSSFSKYLNFSESEDLVDTADILAYYDSREDYKKFVYEGIEDPENPLEKVVSNRYLSSKEFISR